MCTTCGNLYSRYTIETNLNDEGLYMNLEKKEKDIQRNTYYTKKSGH